LRETPKGNEKIEGGKKKKVDSGEHASDVRMVKSVGKLKVIAQFHIIEDAYSFT
jgi:hypothetical protein